MLTCYTLQNNLLKAIPPEAVVDEIERIVWMDLLEPTHAEEQQVEGLIGIDVPTRDEMHEIEFSSRFYQEHGGLFATASFVTEAETEKPEIHAITFVLAVGKLVTVRYSNPKPFQLFIARGGRMEAPSTNGISALIGLMEAVIDRKADILEMASHKIDAISHAVFRPALLSKIERAQAQPDLEEMMRQIGVSGDIVSKTRESLSSISRLLSYVSQSSYCVNSTDENSRVAVLVRDIPGLTDHAAFLTNKLGFLLDATLGMISVEQNAIIKIFSVAAVIFLPPTLVASIYGMNFRFMPELNWHYGYPLALLMMVAAAWLPYRYFKKRKWL